METVITTIFYDGQYWCALVERISGEKIETAKHIFGPEPTNTDLLNFYLETYDRLQFLEGRHSYRLRKKYSMKQQDRMSRSSRDIFKAALTEELRRRKK